MAARAYPRIILHGTPVTITSPINDSLYCLLCSNVLSEPQQTTCGCRFCRECIGKYLVTDSKKCPGDTEDCTNITLREDVRSDAVAKKQINKLMAKCPFEWCELEEEVSKMQIHVSTCTNVGAGEENNGDEDTEVRCTFCDVRLVRSVMESVHCNYDHDDLCDKYADHCPNGCDETETVVWKDHRKMCGAATLLCPYEKLGCDSKLRKSEMNSHLVEDAVKHTEVLLKHIDNLNNEITAVRTELQGNESKNEDMLNAAKAEIRSLSQRFMSVCEVFQRDVNCIREKNEEISNKLSFYNGNFRWIISDFLLSPPGQRLSPSFYVDPNGYRMQLSISTRDTPGFLSIFARLVRGNNDDGLDWPFDRDVTIRILDQEHRHRDYAKTAHFDDAPKESTKRPYRRFGDEYGVPKFICISDLSAKPYLYCDESLWIDCFVDDIY